MLVVEVEMLNVTQEVDIQDVAVHMIIHTMMVHMMIMTGLMTTQEEEAIVEPKQKTNL